MLSMLELADTSIPLAEFSAEDVEKINIYTIISNESHLGQLAFSFQFVGLASS